MGIERKEQLAQRYRFGFVWVLLRMFTLGQLKKRPDGANQPGAIKKYVSLFGNEFLSYAQSINFDTCASLLLSY
jgi:hypothetical protein